MHIQSIECNTNARLWCCFSFGVKGIMNELIEFIRFEANKCKLNNFGANFCFLSDYFIICSGKEMGEHYENVIHIV